MSYKDSVKFQISNNIVFRKQTDGTIVLLEIEGDALFELENVSAFIWDLIAKEVTYGDILEELDDEYEFADSDIKDVNEFLDGLIEKKILELSVSR